MKNEKEQTHYIHVDNGGINVSVEESEYGDYCIKFSTQYHGYPYGEFSLSALNTEQLLEISKFLSKAAAKEKLKDG